MCVWMGGGEERGHAPGVLGDPRLKLGQHHASISVCIRQQKPGTRSQEVSKFTPTPRKQGGDQQWSELLTAFERDNGKANSWDCTNP